MVREFMESDPRLASRKVCLTVSKRACYDGSLRRTIERNKNRAVRYLVLGLRFVCSVFCFLTSDLPPSPSSSPA